MFWILCRTSWWSKYKWTAHIVCKTCGTLQQLSNGKRWSMKFGILMVSKESTNHIDDWYLYCETYWFESKKSQKVDVSWFTFCEIPSPSFDWSINCYISPAIRALTGWFNICDTDHGTGGDYGRTPSIPMRGCHSSSLSEAFLDILKARNWAKLVNNMVIDFRDLNYYMSMKLHYLHCHMDGFPAYLCN